MKKNRIYYKKLDRKKRKHFTKNGIINILTAFPGMSIFTENNPIISAKINLLKKIFIKGKLKDGTIITLSVKKFLNKPGLE